MKLIDAEFEESEYRGPLFNQLESSTLLWEPGQVFENHIGIDRAIWCTSHALFSLHHFLRIPPGVVLSRYRWDYIWTRRRRKKTLPSFRLNLFVQAKRPKYGRFAPKPLKVQGLKSPFWLFSLTSHQQASLEKLQSNLGNRALVCYACPAFHKQSSLYKWTIEPRMVDNSTFPDVRVLAGHETWNFSSPGAAGVANPDPEAIAQLPLMARVGSLIEQTAAREDTILTELQFLARACTATMLETTTEPDSIQARFSEAVREIEAFVNEELDEGREETISFLVVQIFTLLFHLDWLVVGNSG